PRAFSRFRRRLVGVSAEATGLAATTAALGRRYSTSALTGFHARVAAIRTEAPMARTIHAPNDPNQLVHHAAIIPPQSPALALGSPGGGSGRANASATGRRTADPAKKIIQDRSVSDCIRPNSRRACTA